MTSASSHLINNDDDNTIHSRRDDDNDGIGTVRSFLEVPNVASGPVSISKLHTTKPPPSCLHDVQEQVQEPNEHHQRRVSTVSFSGYQCHVVSYSQDIEQDGVPSLDLIVEFDRKVEAACFQGSGILVVTRDGRLWYVNMTRDCAGPANNIPVLPRRLFQRDTPTVQEVLSGTKLWGSVVMGPCLGFSDRRVWVVAGSTLSPPCLVSMISRNEEPECQAGQIDGLEYIRHPITAVLYLPQTQTEPNMWKGLMRDMPASSSSHGVLLLGFADGAVRACLVGHDGFCVGLPQMMGYVNQCNARIIALLYIPHCAIVAVNAHGAVERIGRIWPFPRIAPGLTPGRVWTSAAVLGGQSDRPQTTRLRNGRNGLVATALDGSTHVLFLLEETSVLLEGGGAWSSMLMPVAVRKDALYVTTCYDPDERQLWMAIRTRTGGVVTMQLESLLPTSGKGLGPLESAGHRLKPKLQSSSCSDKVHSLLNDLEQVGLATSWSAYDKTNCLASILKQTGERTKVVLAASHRGAELQEARIEETGDHCVVTAEVASVPTKRSWIPSLHVELRPTSMSLSNLHSTSTDGDDVCTAFYGTAVAVSGSGSRKNGSKNPLRVVGSLTDCTIGASYVAITSAENKEEASVGASRKRKRLDTTSCLRLIDAEYPLDIAETVVVPLPTRLTYATRGDSAYIDTSSLRNK